jgi:predicted MFS family arabinose efflux permease
MYSNGIFIVPIMKEFNTSLSQTSLLATLTIAMFYIIGLFSGPLANKYGVKPVVTIGAIIWVASCLLASLATELWHSILCQGVLAGVGTALVYWPALAVTPQWFKRYRASGMSAAVLGSGLGSIAFSIGGEQLIAEVGWRNTLRIIGGIGGGLLLGSILLLERRTPPHRSAGLFDATRHLIRLRNCQIFTVGVFFFNFAFFVPYAYIDAYSESLGLPASYGAFALAMLGAGSSVGRVFFGPMADYLHQRMLVFRGTLFLAALALALWPLAKDEPSITAFAVIYGATGGGFAAMFATGALGPGILHPARGGRQPVRSRARALQWPRISGAPRTWQAFSRSSAWCPSPAPLPPALWWGSCTRRPTISPTPSAWPQPVCSPRLSSSVLWDLRP